MQCHVMFFNKGYIVNIIDIIGNVDKIEDVDNIDDVDDIDDVDNVDDVANIDDVANVDDIASVGVRIHVPGYNLWLIKAYQIGDIQVPG